MRIHAQFFRTLLFLLLALLAAAQQLPIRWNFGASQSWTDPGTGLLWLPDQIPSGRVVTTPCTERLFAWSARNTLVCSRKEWDGTTGNALEFPVPISGMYRADVYLSESNGTPGSRVLDVHVENQLVYPNLDVFGQSENPTSVFTLTATFPVTDGAFSMRIDSKGTERAATVAAFSLERIGDIPFVLEVAASNPPPQRPLAPPPPPPPALNRQQSDFILSNPADNFVLINPVPRPAPVNTNPQPGVFPVTFVPPPGPVPAPEVFNIPASNPSHNAVPNNNNPSGLRNTGPIIPIHFVNPSQLTDTTSNGRLPAFSPPPPPPPAPMFSQPEAATATSTSSSSRGGGSSSSSSSTWRIDVGATTAHVDHSGVVWDHDNVITRNGSPSQVQNKCLTHGFASYPDPNLLCVFREWTQGTTGVMEFPVPRSGAYTVELILPETYARMGTRVVDVLVEGWVAFSQLDVTKEIGGTPYGMFTLSATQFVTDGSVSVEIRATQGLPVLAAITIVPSENSNRNLRTTTTSTAPVVRQEAVGL